ncbi:MAG: class I SAM-dependent methyltransferase [Minisyncoccia bacterium]
MYSKSSRIKSCRICGNKNLVSLLHLGNQTLTGVFPKDKKEIITSGPLELVKCQETKNGSTCGLVQLAHTYPKDEMYSKNYGYRSGLNKSMLNHLAEKADSIRKIVSLKNKDIILDIGSNDGSFLKNFKKDLTLVGMDPTGFKQYYPSYIKLIPDFFSSVLFKKKFPNKLAKVVTSIAMFYDLDKPIEFMKNIREILADDGIWVTEQSYLPSMLKTNSYDTICHEHLEYYCLKQIKWMADKTDLKIIDVEFNDINGGSFSVTMAKKESNFKESKRLVDKILNQEIKKGMSTDKPIKDLKVRLIKSRRDLISFLKKVKKEDKKIFGYGASTKGNVLLQFCNITEKQLPLIGEVNKNKFGSFTPNTLIPIVDEKEIKKMKPHYLLVLPWHFRDNIIAKEKDYLKSGGVLVFPLPKLELVREGRI